MKNELPLKQENTDRLRRGKEVDSKGDETGRATKVVVMF